MLNSINNVYVISNYYAERGAKLTTV